MAVEVQRDLAEFAIPAGSQGWTSLRFGSSPTSGLPMDGGHATTLIAAIAEAMSVA